MMRMTFKFLFSLGKIVILASCAIETSVALAENLCTTNESVIFSCQFKENKKFVSVCSSKKISQDDGYLQYRYGTPQKIELIYPSTNEDSQRYFGYDYYARPDLTTIVFGFNVGVYRYEITKTIEGGEDSGTVLGKLNVSSSKSGRGLDLTCMPNQDFSSSDLTRVMNIVPCDKENEIVAGACG